MRVLIVCQAFWPDDVATSLFLTDIAKAMSQQGGQVSVWASRYAYEDSAKIFSRQEEYEGINIKRLWSTKLKDKNSFLGRVFNFLTFELSIFYHFFKVKSGKYDLILGLSTPPLVAFLCVLMANIKKIPFVFWNMDLQPELSIQIGKIRRGSLLATLLKSISAYTCRHATKTLVLDQYMKNYLVGQKVDANKVAVTQLWPVIDQVTEHYSRQNNPYRLEKGFGDRIVIMYAGNQSIVHPLDTLLELAKSLKQDDRFLFVFVGGGVRKKDVTNFKNQHGLPNILQFPFEPIEKAHISLAASDIQVVVMGDGLVGLTHPNKVYGAMYVGKPIMYIGPTKSHVTDLLEKCDGNIVAAHGDIQGLKEQLISLACDLKRMESIGQMNMDFINKNFQKSHLRNQMLGHLYEITNRDYDFTFPHFESVKAI